MSTEDSADLFMTLLVQHGHLTDDVYFLVLWRRTQYRYYNACLCLLCIIIVTSSSIHVFHNCVSLTSPCPCLMSRCIVVCVAHGCDNTLTLAPPIVVSDAAVHPGPAVTAKSPCSRSVRPARQQRLAAPDATSEPDDLAGRQSRDTEPAQADIVTTSTATSGTSSTVYTVLVACLLV